MITSSGPASLRMVLNPSAGSLIHSVLLQYFLTVFISSSPLSPLGLSGVIVITPDNPRGLKGEELRETVRKYCNNTECISDPSEGFRTIRKEAGPEDVIIVFGSLSFMGQLGGLNGEIS